MVVSLSKGLIEEYMHKLENHLYVPMGMIAKMAKKMLPFLSVSLCCYPLFLKGCS